MLPKISRYFLVVVTIVTLGYVLPAVYTTLFDTRVNMPYITYSETRKEYFIQKHINGKPVFVDRNGKEYSQQEFMDATPISNFHYHLGKGTLPDSFNHVKLDPRQLQHESNFQWIEPSNIYAPIYNLYPLFESQPEFGLAFPQDFFRMTDRIEFIDAKSNKLNKIKSELYTTALKNAEFEFPARIVSGLPTLMKRKDEGWFIVDTNNELFHLKMVKGKPYVKKITAAEGIYVKHIICADLESDEYYAIIVSGSNELYALNKKDYSLSRFPVNDYNPEKDVLTIIGNQFTKTVSLSGTDGVRVYTMDRSFTKIDEYNEKLQQKSEAGAGKMAGLLFPFQVNVDSPFSSFINITPSSSVSYYFLIFNLVLVVFAAWLAARNARSIKNSIPDLAIIALTGIFGFLAVHIIPNKQYE
jgi:hypothetical protein